MRNQPLDYGAQAGSSILVTFFNAVYGWMCAGLALTAVIAWWVSHNPQVMMPLLSGPAIVILFIAQLGLVITISAATRKLNATAATVLFLLYASINGLMFAGIFVIYPMATIAGAFIASAAMFGAMSVYGMVTKTDLSGMGRILMMLLIGLIVASVVNFFIASNALSWALSYLGVLIFVGLTAYDTQRLQQVALATGGDAALASRMAITGALILYLDFINLFLFILRIFGNRRN
jgi:FtsH-binding integral membrane protein